MSKRRLTKKFTNREFSVYKTFNFTVKCLLLFYYNLNSKNLYKNDYFDDMIFLQEMYVSGQFFSYYPSIMEKKVLGAFYSIVLFMKILAYTSFLLFYLACLVAYFYSFVYFTLVFLVSIFVYLNVMVLGKLLTLYNDQFDLLNTSNVIFTKKEYLFKNLF